MKRRPRREEEAEQWRQPGAEGEDDGFAKSDIAMIRGARVEWDEEQEEKEIGRP